jgi:MFS family permease
LFHNIIPARQRDGNKGASPHGGRGAHALAAALPDAYTIGRGAHTAISAAEAAIGRFYYGWVVVGVGTVAMAVGAFCATSPFSAFLTPMSRDLGWSLTTLNAAQGAGTVAGGLSAPFAGRLVDRYGARVILTVAGLGMGLALLLCAGVQEPWQFFVAYGLGRVLFQGVIQIATPTAVANWFVRLRGRATGLALMGNAIGVALCVPLIQHLADTAGWRTAWAVLGLVALCTLPPLAALLVRRRPEDLGLRPDGAPPEPPPPPSAPREPPTRAGDPTAAAAPAARAAEPAWRVGDAVRTPTFWLLLLTGGFGTFALAGITTYQIPLLLHNGVPPGTAAAMVSLYAVCWAAGGVLWGYFGERVPARYALAVIYLAGAVAAVVLLNATDVRGALAFALLYGLIVGGNSTLEALIWADYYGRATLGSIRGFGRPLLMALNSLGPLVAAIIVDQTGNYAWAYGLFAAINVGIALLVLVARPPRHPTQRAALRPRQSSLP